MGNFIVVDLYGQTLAATSLDEDVNKAATVLKEKLADVHEKLDSGLPGPVTGLETVESCTGQIAQPPGNIVLLSASCTFPKLATGGGCKILGNVENSSLFSNYVNAAVQRSVSTTWACSWRNNSTTDETVDLCAQVICVDSFPPDE